MADCPGEALESCSQRVQHARGGGERPFCCSLPLNSFSFGKKPLASSPRSSSLRLAGELPSTVCAHMCVCISPTCSPFSLLFLLVHLFALLALLPRATRPPRLQIIWNFPFDVKGSLSAARFQLVTPKTNDRFPFADILGPRFFANANDSNDDVWLRFRQAFHDFFSATLCRQLHVCVFNRISIR